MSNSAWKGWQLNELSTKSANEALADTNELKIKLQRSINEFEKKSVQFESSKENLLNSAKEQGLDIGKKEGFEIGYKEGFSSGKSIAEQQFETDLNQKLEFVQSIADELSNYLTAVKKTFPNEIANLINTTINKIIDHSENFQEKNLHTEISSELSKLEKQYSQLTLKVNSDDYSEIINRFSVIFEQNNWKIIIEPLLKKGGFILETNEFKLDSTLESRHAKALELINNLGNTDNG